MTRPSGIPAAEALLEVPVAHWIEARFSEGQSVEEAAARLRDRGLSISARQLTRWCRQFGVALPSEREVVA